MLHIPHVDQMTRSRLNHRFCCRAWASRDRREGTTPEETRSVFAELFHHLGRDEHVRDLDLLFCGPNIPLRLHDTLHSFACSPTPAEKGQGVSIITHTNHGGDADGRVLQNSTLSPPPPPPPAGKLAVKLRYNSGLYHDVSELFPAPTALFLFNAGLWGYDDWEPTLEHVLGCSGSGAAGGHGCHEDGDDLDRPPVIVTSYCPEEASDDTETIQRVVLEADERCKCSIDLDGGLEWLWKPEVNPHRSLVPRETRCGVEGRVLFENQSWQALRRSRGKGASPSVAAET